MDLNKLMDVVKETFENEVYSELMDFAGEPYTQVTGKDEFLNKLKFKLDVMLNGEKEDEITLKLKDIDKKIKHEIFLMKNYRQTPFLENLLKRHQERIIELTTQEEILKNRI